MCRGEGPTHAVTKSTWNSLSGELTDKPITDFKHQIPFSLLCRGPKALPALTVPAQPPGAPPHPTCGPGPYARTWGCQSLPQSVPAPVSAGPHGPAPSPGRCPMLGAGAATWLVGWVGLPGAAWMGLPELLVPKEPQPSSHPRCLCFHVSLK